MEVQFCNDHLIKADIIQMIHSLIFSLPEKDIDRIYKMFGEVYNGGRKFINEEYKSAIFFDTSKRHLLKIYSLQETDTHMGIDFPTWFNFSDEKPKILLVGIDPLRTGDFLRTGFQLEHHMTSILEKLISN